MVQIQRQLSPAQPVFALSNQNTRMPIALSTVDTSTPQFSAKRQKHNPLPIINNILLATFCYAVVSSITGLWKSQTEELQTEHLIEKTAQEIRTYPLKRRKLISAQPSLKKAS